MSDSHITLDEISKRFDKEDLIFLAKNPYLLFRVNTFELFSDYIYSRVKKQNPDKLVNREDDFIVIQSDALEDSLHLYPIWKDLSTSVQSDVCNDVNFAISLLKSKQCKHIYLLFPKNEHFRKHIPIKIPHLEALGLEYTLKLVPYKIH